MTLNLEPCEQEGNAEYAEIAETAEKDLCDLCDLSGLSVATSQ